MKRIITLLMMMFFMAGYVSAQERNDKEEVVINHTVELGETVLLICKKYVVLPGDFYKYNKEAIHGIRPKEVVRIPLHKSKKKNAIEAFKENGNYATVSTKPVKASAKN